MQTQIHGYNDFVAALAVAGFTIGGGNNEGIFTLNDRFGPDVHWFTEDPDVDPWMWRMRILSEQNTRFAYGKFFFRKSGYITREWLPYFYALRRGSDTFDDRYERGLFSVYAKRVYDAVRESSPMAVHEIRRVCGFTAKETTRMERALTELQMSMFLTVCGHTRRVSSKGEYGWHVSILDMPERLFGTALEEEAEALSIQEAAELITQHVREINPAAETKRLRTFMYG